MKTTLRSAIAHPRFADVFADSERDERTDCHERLGRKAGVGGRPTDTILGCSVEVAGRMGSDWLEALAVVAVLIAVWLRVVVAEQ